MRFFCSLLLILITQRLSIRANAIDTDLAGQEPYMDDSGLMRNALASQHTTNDGNEYSSTSYEANTVPLSTTGESLSTTGESLSTTVDKITPPRNTGTTTKTTPRTFTTTTATTTTTTTTTTTKPVWTKEPPPHNPTWSIIGGLIGGIGGLALIGAGVGVYMCFRASQKQARSRGGRTGNNDDIPLEDYNSH